MNKKATVVISLIIIGFAILVPSYLYADPLDNWDLKKENVNLESVVYGNSLFVGVGGGGAVWTSPNGAAWTKRTSGTNKNLYQVAYGNSTFVAVGESGTIITSQDGITWPPPRISRTTNTLRGVAFGNGGNGFFMAVGYSATVVTSPDGITWESKTPNTTKSLKKLRFLNNLFVTIDYWSATILNSSDGTSWNEPHITQAGYVPSDVAYGGGTYVVVGGYGEIFTSPDLVTWTERTNTGMTTNSLNSVIYAEGLFVAFGSSGTIITSPDGINWMVRPCPTSYSLNDVTFGGGTFVAVGWDAIQSDPMPTPNIFVNPTALNFGNVIVGDGSNQQVTVRNDGNADLIIGTITSPSLPFNKITDNCSGQTLAPGASCTITYYFSPTSIRGFSSNSNIPSNDPDENSVTVSLNGVGVAEIVTAPNTPEGPAIGNTGVSYSYTTGGSTSSLGHSVMYRFDFGDGTYSAWSSSTTASHSWSYPSTFTIKAQAQCATDTSVVSGWSSAFMVTISSDDTGADPLDNWYLRRDLSPDVLESVVYGNGLFVGVGGDNIWTSPNGAAWTKRTSGTDKYLYQVAYGNSTFVAVGSSGTIITSPNGITWTRQISRTTNDLRGVAFGNGFFMAVGFPETVVTSPDGITWAQITITITPTPDTTRNLKKLRYVNNLFVTIDYGSAIILRSADGTIWNESPNIPEADYVPNDVAYGNNTYPYVAVGGDGEIFTSPDLVTWEKKLTSGVTTNTLNSVIYAEGFFVAVGSSGTIITSPDGINWRVRPYPTSDLHLLNDVTFGRGTLVAVGYDAIQSDPIIGVPHIFVNPTALNFGNVIAGNGSNQQVTVRNDGNADLIIGAITSPSLPFSKTIDTCSGQTLAPDASCTITYYFSPTSIGSFSNNSTIPSNDPDENSVTVSLNGVGVPEIVTIPNILTGPVSGTVGVAYSYTTGGSTSSLGHSVMYRFDFGDGTYSAWSSSTTASHSWSYPSTFTIKAQAQCSTDTSIVSGWSSGLMVTISSVGAGRATRDLPDCYTPSGLLSVTITVTPSGPASNYVVEETPPSGWLIQEINENGQLDYNKIKWGPFFDRTSRTLIYKAIPTSNTEPITKTFSGTASFDGMNVGIVGESSIDKCTNRPHPADTNNNFSMAINEVVAYGSAWKTGLTWPTPPNPIPVEYVTNVVYLWKMGEVYHYDGSASPPWVPVAASIHALTNQTTLQIPIGLGTGSATRTLPSTYEPSVVVSVSISVNPGQGTQGYAVEETPPNGWGVSDINESGQWDSVNKKVKWGPFFDANNRTLTYKTTPPVGETGTKTFSGTASFDGTNVTISGSSSILRKGAAIPDFNGDGQADILWRNKTTRQNVVWFMNGTTYSNYAELMQVTDTNWQIMGTGDFNGDGKTDVLWRNTSTGQNVVWLMDGVNYGGYAWLLEVADLNWEIVGTGDFNGDGKTDILWRNKGTGQNVVWFMDGATYSSYAELMQVADANWEIVGTGDFNGDGKTDILWRNKSTGQNVVWYMNGAVYSSYAELMQVTDTNWQIVGTGDFNNDGKVDILWRNKSTGQNEVWFMNGAAFSSYSLIDTVADTNWEIVGPK